MPGLGVTNRLLNVPIRWMGAGLGVVALGVAGMFHGLQPSTKPGLPEVKPGVVSTGGPWNVTVNTAKVASDLSPLRPSKDGNRWFIVIATIEITADESRNDVRDAIKVKGVAGLLHPADPDYVLLARDATNVSYLSPGMPERIGFVWEQSGTAPLPTKVDVGIIGMTYREDTLTRTATAKGEMIWTDDEVRAHVVVPVVDARK
jgi:hypothetical protein